MERRIGEIFEYDGVKLKVAKETRMCDGCFFRYNFKCRKSDQKIGECQAASRSDGGVVFVKVEDMEERNIKLTLEKAREFFNKGGEFRDLALSAFTEEELDLANYPSSWEQFCMICPVKEGETFVDSNSNLAEYKSKRPRLSDDDRNCLPDRQAAEAHRALCQLHQLRDFYRKGWKPIANNKLYYIQRYINNSLEYEVVEALISSRFLSFPTKEVANKFLNNFTDLIREAGDLI